MIMQWFVKPKIAGKFLSTWVAVAFVVFMLFPETHDTIAYLAIWCMSLVAVFIGVGTLVTLAPQVRRQFKVGNMTLLASAGWHCVLGAVAAHNPPQICSDRGEASVGAAGFIAVIAAGYLAFLHLTGVNLTDLYAVPSPPAFIALALGMVALILGAWSTSGGENCGRT